MTSLVFGSRFPVGSSARMSTRAVDSARAMATRCCSPPDSSPGRCRSRSPSPTSVSAAVGARPRLAPGSGARGAPGSWRSRARSSRPAGCRTGTRSPPRWRRYRTRAASPPREEVLPANEHAPGGRAVQRAEKVQQGGLAHAGGADQRHHLAAAIARATRTSSAQDSARSPARSAGSSSPLRSRRSAREGRSSAGGACPAHS